MHTVSLQSVGLSLNNCIKCNICTSYCPVSEVTDLFPGPKYAAPQAERFRALGQPLSPDISVDYCSGCRVCNEVCPTGVHIAEMNARARAQVVAERGLSLRNRALGRTALIGRLGSCAPTLANFLLHNRLSRRLAASLAGLAQEAPLPRWSRETFRRWLRRTRSQRLRSEKKVVYFHGCATQNYEPHIGKATVLVLERLGYEVVVPRQSCCGLPLLSNGEFAAAERYYRRNLADLGGHAGAGYDILGSSTSCTLTLKDEAPELLDLDGDAGAQALKSATWDVFEWLRERMYRDGLPGGLRPPLGNGQTLVLPYHPPCQLRAHRIGTPALEVLARIPGLEVRLSQARCCGIAGTYGYKTEKYRIAMDVGAELFDYVVAQAGSAEPQQTVAFTACDSETCRWQLEHGTGLPSRHPIEVLAAAYGLYDLNARQTRSGV